MKTLEQLGLKVPDILLPKNIETSSWSVIACDQYTQDKAYWTKTLENTQGKPSTLNLILPEVYLSEDKDARIKKIRQTMTEYLQNDVFAQEKSGFIYLERKTAYNRTRKGLMVEIDLDTYEWKPFSKANIRATEATIVDRIPPRMEIRRGAPLELPHIMLLVNDKENMLMATAKNLTKNKTPVYDGAFMCNGGSITGWIVENKDELEKLTQVFNTIALNNTGADGSTFLFAVGDGNHSLATAKAVWDEYKAQMLKDGATEQELKNSKIRYALVEIVNLYDTGLTFEPIHRVIFNADANALINFLSEKLSGSVKTVSNEAEMESNVKTSWANFGFMYKGQNGKQNFCVLETDIKELAVSKIQPAIDEFLKKNSSTNVEIDYIHGSEEVYRLGKADNAISIMLPPIAKDSFFETINSTGPLPRKSFSMGEADEKRFYLECRRLFG